MTKEKTSVKKQHAKFGIRQNATQYLPNYLGIMTDTRPIPVTLSVVSYVFLALAIFAVVGMLGSALRGSIHLDLNVLGFWIFLGLRRYSVTAHTGALILIWITMIACAFGFIFGIFGHGTTFITVFGRHYAEVRSFWLSIIAAIYFLFTFWMYRVLTRPSIWCLFHDV